MDKFCQKSYSQEGEDMILNRIFENCRRGFYIDVGAHHPVRFSNTFYFYQRGWTGINIDAMPGSMDQFNVVRKRDINLEIAISDRDESLVYYMFNEPALNGFSKIISEKRSNLPNYSIIRKKPIRTVTLSSVLDQHLGAARDFEFLSIDVEGLDFSVLKSNNWNRYRPKVVLVEILNQCLNDIVVDPISKYLIERDYQFFAKCVNTVIFIDNQFYDERFKLDIKTCDSNFKQGESNNPRIPKVPVASKPPLLCDYPETQIAPSNYEKHKSDDAFSSLANRFKFEKYIAPGDTIIELGCGSGFLLKNLKARNKLGIESNEMARVEALHNGIFAVEKADLLPDSYADVIISDHALAQVGNPIFVLKEIQRKLKKGGKAIFVVPYQGPEEEYQDDGFNNLFFTWNAQTLGNLFKSAGFHVIDVNVIQHQFPPNYRQVFDEQGEKNFYNYCKAYAEKNSHYQLRIIASREFDRTVDQAA